MSFNEALFQKMEKIERLATAGASQGEKDAAMKALLRLEETYPGLTTAYSLWKTRRTTQASQGATFTQEAQRAGEEFLNDLTAMFAEKLGNWSTIAWTNANLTAKGQLAEAMKQAGDQIDSFLGKNLEALTNPEAWKAAEKTAADAPEEYEITLGEYDWGHESLLGVFPTVVEEIEWFADADDPNLGSMVKVTLVFPAGALNEALRKMKHAQIFCERLAEQLGSQEDE